MNIRMLLVNLMCLSAGFYQTLSAQNIHIYNGDKTRQIHYFHDIAISDVESRDQKNILSYKIMISKIKQIPNPEKHFFLRLAEPETVPAPGEIIWEITNPLPITANACIMAYADICTKATEKLYEGSCFEPCISYGPEFLAFDEKSGRLYITAASSSIGTGGGPYFLFAADIKKKQLQYLINEHGPFKGSLSPSGTFLLLYSANAIKIHNIKTGSKFIISEKNNWSRHHTVLHMMDTIHWLSDTQFSYQDGIRHSKFQGSFDNMKENIYDIPSGKIIHSRVMAANEYNSRLYVESN